MNNKEITPTKTTWTKSKSIVFTDSSDLRLMREVVTVNPYADPAEWTTVAENLTMGLKLEKPATKRTVQEINTTFGSS